MVDLIDKLRAAIDEDERWALACNRPYEYATEGSVAPATGVHWQWVEGEDWTPVAPDPMLDEFVADAGYSCNLVTVEEWPTSHRPMPRAYANSIVEFDSAAAGHIVRHDPARVLRQVAAHRKILEAHPVKTEVRTWHDGKTWHGCYCSLDRQGEILFGRELDCEIILALTEGYGIQVEEKV